MRTDSSLFARSTASFAFRMSSWAGFVSPRASASSAAFFVAVDVDDVLWDDAGPVGAASPASPPPPQPPTSVAAASVATAQAALERRTQRPYRATCVEWPVRPASWPRRLALDTPP